MSDTPPPIPPRPPPPGRAQPILPLGYQDRYTAPIVPQPLPLSPARVTAQFLGGLLGGGLISALIWIPGFSSFMKSGDAGVLLLIAVPGVKLTAAIIFLCIRGWRMLGAGILLSIAVGFIIFFFSCAAQIK